MGGMTISSAWRCSSIRDQEELPFPEGGEDIAEERFT